MKNKRPLFVVLLCLLLAGGVVLALLPRCPMPWQCSKLYWQYRGQEGIEASYVRDYPVDDTTLVDVTLLHATTDSAWVSMCLKSLPYDYPEDYPEDKRENVIHGNSVTQYISSKDDIRTKVIPADTNNYNLVFINARQKYIVIFHTENKTQVSILLDKITIYMLHNNSKNPLP